MKKIWILFFVVSSQSFAQFHPLTYDWGDYAQSFQINPGVQYPYPHLLSVPLLGSVQAFIGNTGFSLGDLFSTGGNFNDKIRNVAGNLKNSDFFNLQYRQDLFTYGWTDDLERFKYFGMYWELNHFNTIPGSFIRLGLEGNSPHLFDTYNAKFISTQTEFVQTFYYGRVINTGWKWNWGYRLKLYLGIANAQSIYNQGKFYTTEGQNNYYLHHLDDVNLHFNSSGLDGELTKKDLLSRFIFSKNFGPGIDLGFTYQADERLQYSASLLDFGFIYYTSGIRNYGIKGNYVFEGANLQFPEVGNIDYWKEIKKKFNEQIQYDENQKSYISWRPTTVYVGFKYGLNNLKHPKCEDFLNIQDTYTSFVGISGFYQYRPFANLYLGASVYYERKWSKHFFSRVNLTADNFGWSSLGAAGIFNFKPVQIFISAENITGFSDLSISQKQSLNFGINLYY